MKTTFFLLILPTLVVLGGAWLASIFVPDLWIGFKLISPYCCLAVMTVFGIFFTTKIDSEMRS